MRGLETMVEQYLQIRRAQGSKAADVGRILEKFCQYIEATHAPELTVEVAVGFATATDGLSDRSIALRLSAVRGFCRWAQTLDPRIEVPPHGLLKAHQTRNVPYIYAPAEITELLDVAANLRPRFRATTMATLVGLMAATGIRTGEACALDLTDFNPAAATLRIKGKYGKIRLLPLHDSVAEALSEYVKLRDELAHVASCPALLVSSLGNRLPTRTVDASFRQIRDASSLDGRSRRCTPRLMDLRHTFAVTTMIRAYETDQDPISVLPVLSTWLGHALISDTYWYLSATPELMQAAAQRLEEEDR